MLWQNLRNLEEGTGRLQNLAPVRYEKSGSAPEWESFGIKGRTAPGGGCAVGLNVEKLGCFFVKKNYDYYLND